MTPSRDLFPDNHIAGCQLRPTSEADFPWQVELFSSIRALDRQLAPLPDEQWWPLMEMQVRAQELHYQTHYDACRLDILERDGQRIGRLYTGFAGPEIRLMDIALVPPHRNQGLGTQILAEMMRIATLWELPLSLHVEQFNPAHRLYTRMGFVPMEMRGIYQYLKWTPPTQATVSAA